MGKLKNEDIKPLEMYVGGLEKGYAAFKISEVVEIERQLEGFKDQYNINSELTEQIESMKCCGNCEHYRTIPVKYHLEEYCNIIDDPQHKRDIAKYDNNCINWKMKTNG